MQGWVSAPFFIAQRQDLYSMEMSQIAPKAGNHNGIKTRPQEEYNSEEGKQ